MLTTGEWCNPVGNMLHQDSATPLSGLFFQLKTATAIAVARYIDILLKNKLKIEPQWTFIYFNLLYGPKYVQWNFIDFQGPA